MPAVTAVLGVVATALLMRTARRSEITARLPSRGVLRLPRRARAGLARAIDDAGLHTTPEEATQVWLLGVLALTIVTWPLGPVAVGVALLGATASVPVAMHLVRERSEHAIAGGVPALLEQTAAELRAGANVRLALERVTTGPLAPDIGRVSARARAGANLHHALAAWADERDAPGVRSAAGALAVAANVGGPAAAALDGLASSLRDRLEVLAEARALSAQARLSAIVVGLAPFGYLAFSALVDRRTLDALVATPIGRTCALVGLSCEALAALWMRHILHSVGAP